MRQLDSTILTGVLAVLLISGATSIRADVIEVPCCSTAAVTNALAAAQEGDVIELAAGTYASPANGWVLSGNGIVSFTLRAADEAVVTLDGGGSRPIFKLLAPNDTSASVVFEGLTFSNGFSDLNGTAGGVTLAGARATFVDSRFLNNTSDAANTGGGAVALFVSGSTPSVGHFFDCEWTGNSATNEGAALKVGGGSEGYVHRGVFEANRTDLPGHRTSAAGGAIHVATALSAPAASSLVVTDSLFDSNRAGCVGGAIFSYGEFDGVPSTPRASVRVANSWFLDNEVEPDPGVTCTFRYSGGALHIEDQARIQVYYGRFDGNTAEDGGAVSMYRADLEIADSVFRGNRAIPTVPNSSDTAWGGAINLSSQDTSGDFGNPAGSITIERSLFQGTFEGSSPEAIRGGCIWVLGDTRSTYGLNGVPADGDLAENRPPVTISDSVFHECSVQGLTDGGNVPNSGMGGGILATHVDLDIDESLFVGNSGSGGPAQGGAMRVLTESNLTVADSTFAHNETQVQGGALALAGISLGSAPGQGIDSTQFFGNDVLGGGLGAAIFSGPLSAGTGAPLDMTGDVSDSTFSDHAQIPIREEDNHNGPINSVTYRNNDFSDEAGPANIFSNQIAGGATPSGLNSMVVTRSGATNTDKAPANDNSDLGSEPDLVALVTVPPQLNSVEPAGAVGSWESFVATAWSGGAATLNGQPLAGDFDLQAGGIDGYTLAVGAASVQGSITAAPTPSATFTASPAGIDGGESSTLSWNVTAGDFLGAWIDRGVDLVSPQASDSVMVSPNETTTYRLHVLTAQGGVSREVTVYVGELPGVIFIDGFESGNTSNWN